MLKKYRIYIIMLAIVIIIPLIFEYYILGNNPNSRTTADAWAGFFGGYLGAIIGAIATIVGIRMQSRLDEEKRLRPFLYIILHKTDMTPSQKIHIHNAGLHSACNIEYGAFIQGKEKVHSTNINILNPNDDIESSISASDFGNQEFFFFYFYDIIGNRYEQKICITVIDSDELPNVNHKNFTSCTSEFPQRL